MLVFFVKIVPLRHGTTNYKFNKKDIQRNLLILFKVKNKDTAMTSLLAKQHQSKDPIESQIFDAFFFFLIVNRL